MLIKKITIHNHKSRLLCHYKLNYDRWRNILVINQSVTIRVRNKYLQFLNTFKTIASSVTVYNHTLLRFTKMQNAAKLIKSTYIERSR